MPWDGIRYDHVAISARPQIIIAFIHTISVVDTVKNMRYYLAFVIIDDGELEIMVAISGYDHIFHLETWIVLGTDKVDSQENGIVRHMQVIRFQYFI